MPRTGRPPAITKDDILAVLRERDRQRHPVMTAPEIAEHVDASRQTVVNRLKEMKGAGEINTTELIGTPVWWPPDEGMTPMKAASIEATADTDQGSDPDDGGDAPDPEEPDVVADGMGWGLILERGAAIWAQRTFGAGIVLGLAGILAWLLTKLPISDLLPALAAVGAMVAGFVAILAGCVLMIIAGGLAAYQGHGRGELLEYVLERALYSTPNHPPRR